MRRRLFFRVDNISRWGSVMLSQCFPVGYVGGKPSVTQLVRVSRFLLRLCEVGHVLPP